MALKVKKNIDEKSEDLLKEVEKVSKEVDKEEKKKDKKDRKDKKDKKDSKKNDDKKTSVKKESWWQGVKSEFKKVRWPSKKEMIKYSIATICFIIFFALFFWIIELVAWLLKTM